MNRPEDARALENLDKEESQLAADRHSALAQEQAADRALDTQLQRVDLPAVPTSGASAR